MIADLLPDQFLMEYTYEFLYKLRANTVRLKIVANADNPLQPRNVLDELTLYLISEESEFILEAYYNDDEVDSWARDWVYDLNEDANLMFILYTNQYIPEWHPYHFDHWDEELSLSSLEESMQEH